MCPRSRPLTDRGHVPGRFDSVYVENAEGAWEETAGGIREVGATEAADLRHAQHVDWVSRLWPLRRPEYRLAPLGRHNVRGAETIGVRVSHEGEADVDLYFAVGTWRLVKKAFRHEVDHLAVYNETFYSDWKTASGVGYASHAEVTSDRKAEGGVGLGNELPRAHG